MSTRSTRFGVAPDEMDEPDGYQGWSADQKSRWLWRTLIGATAHKSTSLPALVLPFKTAPRREITVVTKRAELEKTLTRTSDLMEAGRPKFIHARGAVALIELETSVDSPFTGILGPSPKGGASGLIRMSLVAKVDRKAAYTPAMALKFLIDHKPSADVLAMNHTVGQGRDFNLFSNTMTNDLTDAHNALRAPQKLMNFLFKRISHQPRRMVSTHLADQHRDGTKVEPAGQVVAPHRLIFHPTPQAKALFSGRADVDFRLVLAELPEQTPLYTVVGVTGSKTAPVGAVRTTTRFVSSDGGDRLFFRHVHDPADRKTSRD